MKTLSFELNPTFTQKITIQDIAKELGEQSNEEQAEFLKEFFSLMLSRCGYPAFQSQLCWISETIDPKTFEYMNDIVEFYKMKEPK